MIAESKDDGMMSAVALSEYGTGDVLKYQRMKKPVPGPTDCLVRNLACGMNPVDYKVRTGAFDQDPPAKQFGGPRVLGWDGAGVVEAVGSDVKTSEFEVGDEVYYMGHLHRNGSNAEYTTVDKRQLALKPKNLTFTEAAAVPLVGQTAHEAIVEQMRVEAGKTMLVYNGAGGLGSFAVQLSKAMGLTVVATASRDESRAMCREMGADHVINHRQPLKEQLEKLGMKGVNYIFNCYDPKLTGMLMPLLLTEGAIANINPPTAEHFAAAKDELFGFWWKRASLHSTFVFARCEAEFQVERDALQLQELTKLYEAGKLKPTVKKTFKLEEMAAAHAWQESGKAIGKIGLTIDHAQADLKTLKPPVDDSLQCNIL